MNAHINAMQMAEASSPASPELAAAPVDLYTSVHKGLRWALCHVLLDLGRVDVDDSAERARLIDDLDGVLYLLERHLEHEDRHVQPLMQRVAPDLEHRLSADHRSHESALVHMRQLIRDAQDAKLTDTSRSADEHERAFAELYIRFSQLVAHQLEHMATEELRAAPAIYSACSQAELEVAHGAILASIGPDEMRAYLRVMLPAARPAARRQMEAELRQQGLSDWLPSSQR